jgi:hypothetical protein
MQNMMRAGVIALLLTAACDSQGNPAGPRGVHGDGIGSGQPGAGSGQPGGSSGQAGGGTSAEAIPTPPYKASRGDALLWKRHAAFEADLMRALELGRDEVCKELGARDCIRDIHVIALGGNDPFRSGINVPPSQPLSTTSIVVDRVLLSACSARARADKAGSPKVFRDLILTGAAPASDSPAVKATIDTLFQRFLARDPKPSEVAVVKRLLDGDDAPASAEEFATLACFAIGSSLEFLFL